MDSAGSQLLIEPVAKKNSRRTWSKFEEDGLLTILEDIVVKGSRCDNGTFKSGTMKEIEEAMENLFANSGLKAYPHIENKMRMLKKQYGIVYDMISKSGFAWNDTKKCVEVDSDQVWAAYIQQNKDAAGWRNKSFPIYDRLVNIFGKDRATGKEAETPAEMVENMDQEHNANDVEEEQDESPRSVSQSSSMRSTKRKRSRSEALSDGMAEVISSHKNMVEQSIEQIKLITEKLFQDNENGKDIANELQQMGLPTDEQFDALLLMFEKPQYAKTFMSIEMSLREQFVRRIIREIRYGV
ncbi:hypothetical protein UlMin_043922 [Ulmus minor]